jgi:hypothetical protein
LSVIGDGTGVVAHAGSAGLRFLADRVGLTGAVSAAQRRTPRHRQRTLNYEEPIIHALKTAARRAADW